MPDSKNAFIRYKVLDKCFRSNTRNYLFEDLVKECDSALSEIDPEHSGISVRQIRMDIAYMRSIDGWDIELDELYDGKKRIYRYKDTNYSILNSPLHETEIQQLHSAIDVLAKFDGLPQFSWVDKIFEKINGGKNPHSPKIIEFDSNQYLKGLDKLGELFQAILNKKVFEISYKPYGSEDSVIWEIHPYFLKQYNKRWFLFGYNASEVKYDWNLPLDRINEITEIDSIYVENTEINWLEYFEDMIGVTKPIESNPQNIVLHFFGRTGFYIESKPLDGSQKSNWIDPEILEVKLHLIINYELEQIILSFTPNVKVIEPKSLQISIKKKLRQGLNR